MRESKNGKQVSEGGEWSGWVGDRRCLEATRGSNLLSYTRNKGVREPGPGTSLRAQEARLADRRGMRPRRRWRRRRVAHARV